MVVEVDIAKKFIEITPRMIHFQYRVLSNIHRGLNTVTEIAVHHGVSQPTTTKVITAMFQKSWLKKNVTYKTDIKPF